ncbi:LuxR family transcriptional regulator [Rhizocola hellebori]|uniref:LuxR family transcriptional regulator n=1 Tax=Rhizocola hellebori TaxID=1392758 RepID=A0A8J3QFI2_9ACTN|nr:LuxR family transcriptional regulator [Rhizocola hellebori]
MIGDALADRADGSGVLVVGASGVGKTRLVHEAVSRLDRRTVVRLAGTAAAQGIPLAPVLAVFPDITAAPEQGIPQARARLAGRRTRPVLMVDDAHWLDSATQTLLHLLVSTRQVRAVVIAAGDFPIPPTVSDLWKNGHLERIDLQPLAPIESARLVEALVGAPVVAAVTAELHVRSNGLPLALRELVTEAMASKALIVEGGLGRAVAPLPASRRLGEVVAANLAATVHSGREALDVVVLAEPISLQMLLRVVDQAQVSDAERSGLIRVSSSRLGRLDRHVVTAGHRLYAQTAQAELGPLRRRQILERLADVACEQADGSEALALQAAAWCLEIGRPVTVDSLLRATRLTHRSLDPAQATQFAGQLWRQRPDFETGLLYATTLARQQRYESSLEVLRQLLAHAHSDEERMTRASMTNEILARLGRHDEAMAELRQAERTVRSRRAQAHLVARRAFTANLAGRTREGLILIDPLLRSDDQEERHEAQTFAVVMLALDGRAEEALALAHELELLSEVGPDDSDRLAPHRQMAAVQRGYALMYSGRLIEAQQWAAQGLRMAEEHGSEFLLAAWLNLGARVELERGDPGRAILPLGRLIAEVPEVSGGAQRALAHSALVEAHAMLGQVSPAREALAALAENPGNVAWHPAGSAQIAAALLAFAEGDPAGAMALFEDGYHRAAPANGSIALSAAHMVSRYGLRRAGLDMARELPAVQGKLPELRLAHLEALVAGDVERLLAVAEGFAELGADLLAAEAFAVAAAQATARGDTRRAANATMAGKQIATRLGNVRTPDLLALTSPASIGLTKREREVARLAANGMTSQAIAGSLVVSVRTVENHLQNVFRKVGVRNRQELRDALG